jgi:GH18 family chitinase
MKAVFALSAICGLAQANQAIAEPHPADAMLPLPSYASKVGSKNGNGQVFSAYIVNWAHYRATPYTYTADSFKPIASRVDVALYSFMYFCPPSGSTMPYWAKDPYGNCTDDTEYQLLSVDPADDKYIPSIVGMTNKVVFSVGGWNFPSAYFSKMASSAEGRGKFVASVKSWMDKYGVHGVDLDWEFPCSGARTNPVKITCDKFQTVQDEGGKCPDDGNNLVLLVKDLRAGLGADALITIASQAGRKNAANQNVPEVTPYLDAWHVMTYDYAVSDTEGGKTTSPNCPLFMPKSAPAAEQMSVKDSMDYYLEQNVPVSKLMFGVPLYAHTWFVPGLTGQENWGKFGLTAKIQGLCCGPFKSTYGAKFGKGCSLCGSMMYSEILEAGCPSVWDNETQSDIAYCETEGKDGYTPAGTWMSWNSIKSAQAFVAWEIAQGMAGIFVYSTDMDTVDSGGTWTYKYMNAMADAIGSAPTTPPTPAPPTPPTPPTNPPNAKCDTWVGICPTCSGGSGSCIECKSNPALWQCP